LFGVRCRVNDEL